MILNMMKTNLPWIAPSVAIVLAATGFFDRSDRNDTPAQVAVAQQTVPVEAAPVQQQQGVDVNEVSRTTNIASSLDTLAVAGVLSDQNASEQASLTQVAAVAPETYAPVAPAAPDLGVDPAGFFAAAQANLAGQASCVEDLRNLTNNARVYFPSGGLSGEERGLGQARLIGLVAQNCPGVQIRVGGHSDPTGDPQINLDLSQQRAEAVVARIAASGIDTSRFVAKGYGEAKPSTVTGPRPSEYYDRRVEFELIETTRTASLDAFVPQQRAPVACVQELQAAVLTTNLFFAPRSITTSYTDFNAALELATKATACPQARLRVVGQHSDQIGSGETAATGRMRAAALMSALMGEGIDAGQIIVAAPSWSQEVPGRSGLSNHRIDFDVILEDG